MIRNIYVNRSNNNYVVVFEFGVYYVYDASRAYIQISMSRLLLMARISTGCFSYSLNLTVVYCLTCLEFRRTLCSGLAVD